MKKHFTERYPFASNSGDYLLAVFTIAALMPMVCAMLYTATQAGWALLGACAFALLHLHVVHQFTVRSIRWAEELRAVTEALSVTAYAAKDCGEDTVASWMASTILQMRDAVCENWWRSGWLRWGAKQRVCSSWVMGKLIYGWLTYAVAGLTLGQTLGAWWWCIVLPLLATRTIAVGLAGAVGDNAAEVAIIYSDDTLLEFAKGRDSHGSANKVQPVAKK
jgi:hypothetical protein